MRFADFDVMIGLGEFIIIESLTSRIKKRKPIYPPKEKIPRFPMIEKDSFFRSKIYRENAMRHWVHNLIKQKKVIEEDDE